MEPRNAVPGGWPENADGGTIQELEGIAPPQDYESPPPPVDAHVSTKDAIQAEDVDHETLRRCLSLRKPYTIRTERGEYFDIAADTVEAFRIRRGLGITMLPGDPLDGYAADAEDESSDEPIQSEFVSNRPELDPNNPVIVTRQMAEEARQREAEGVLMELPYTGGFARVRLLELADKTSLGWVPEHLRDKLARVMNLVNDPNAGGAVVSGTEAFQRILKTTTDIEELANAFCIRGFVKPRLVATAAELDESDPYQMLVTQIHINERVSYVNACMPTPEEARILDPFRRKPASIASGKQGNKAAAKAKPLSRIR